MLANIDFEAQTDGAAVDDRNRDLGAIVPYVGGMTRAPSGAPSISRSASADSIDGGLGSGRPVPPVQTGRASWCSGGDLFSLEAEMAQALRQAATVFGCGEPERLHETPSGAKRRRGSRASAIPAQHTPPPAQKKSLGKGKGKPAEMTSEKPQRPLSTRVAKVTKAPPQRPLRPRVAPPCTLDATEDDITDAQLLQMCRDESEALVPRVSKKRMREAGAKLAKDKPAGKEPGGGGAKRKGGAQQAKRRKRKGGAKLGRRRKHRKAGEAPQVGVAAAAVAAGEQCAANSVAVVSAADGQVAPNFPPSEWPPINFRIDTTLPGWKNALHTRQQMQINNYIFFGLIRLMLQNPNVIVTPKVMIDHEMN